MRHRSGRTCTTHRCAAASIILLTLTAASEAVLLDTLLARGDSSIAIAWTPDSVNTRPDWYRTYGSGCTGVDSVYQHCDFLPGQTYRSVAYSYGGEDGHERFRQKLLEGFLVGSHLCHYNSFGDPSAVVAGTDCSGFVCYLWDVPRVSTGGLYDSYVAITRQELDVGDILVRPGSHAVLVVEREDSTRFLIWESTSVVNGCRERLIDITDSYWDAYYPRRYTGIGTGVGQAGDRVPRRSFPAMTLDRTSGILRFASAWRGTVSLYSVQGARAATWACLVERGEVVRLDLRAAAGVRVVELRAEDGSVKAGPVSVYP
jgi:hypothetical protein